MQLYFCRHAESFNNSIEGHAAYFDRRLEEPPLTDKGRRQADALARLIAGDPELRSRALRHRIRRNPWNHEGFGITHLYCSLQRRAVETARAIAQSTGLRSVAWQDLHECGGVLRYDPASDELVGAAGAGPREAREWDPGITLPDGLPEGGWWAGRPMERHEESARRAARVWNELLERHGGTDDQVVFVSHSMFYVFFLCQVLDTAFRHELWFTLANAAVSRLDIGDGDDFEPGIESGRRRLPGLPVRVAYLNRLDHLPVELLS